MPNYAPIILPADLNSVVYPEIQDEISRNDGGGIAAEAIDTAIGEAKMYLTRYDLVALFGDPLNPSPGGTAATFTDKFLTRTVKHMAIWYFIQLANVNINYESQKVLYEQAIASLKRIQKAEADPQWPLATQSQAATPSFGGGSIINNPLRNTSGYSQQQQLPKIN